MLVTETPRRFVDDDGNPIEQFAPEGSRFERIAIKKTDDAIEVRAKETGSDTVVSMTASVKEELYRGCSVADQRRRDIDDDILDVLMLAGYSIVDTDVRRY